VAIVETGQIFMQGRHGRMHDFLIKALAVILGAAAMWILRCVRRTRPPP
jgi:hypothetical protein